MDPSNEKIEDRRLQDAEIGDIDDIEHRKMTRKILWKLDTRYGSHLSVVRHHLLCIESFLF